MNSLRLASTSGLTDLVTMRLFWKDIQTLCQLHVSIIILTIIDRVKCYKIDVGTGFD